MSLPPISQNRALTTLDTDGVILPDVRNRLMRLFEKKKAKNNQLKLARNAAFALAAGSLVLAMIMASVNSDVPTRFGEAPPGFLPFMGVAVFAALGGAFAHLQTIIEKRLPLPCPYCQMQFDLLSQWRCGNCHKCNNDERHEFSTAFHECEEEVCSSPKQTGIACPKCYEIIVLDKARFAELNSAQEPHIGVAFYRPTPTMGELAAQMGMENEDKKSKEFFD